MLRNKESDYVQLPQTQGAGGGNAASSSSAATAGGLDSTTFFEPSKSHMSDYNLRDLARKSAVGGPSTHGSVTGDSPFTLANAYHIFLSAPFWACMAYSGASVAMVLLNKLVLTTYHFEFPMILLLHQNLTTVLTLYVARSFDLLTFEELDRARVIRWIPVDVFFTSMLVTSAFSVQLLSVPMVTIFKNTANIFIAVGDSVIFGNTPSRGVVYALGLMLSGAVMTAANDLEFNLVGYAWTLANCLTATAFVLYTQTAIAKTNLSTFGKVYINNLLAIPLVVLADLFVFGEIARISTLDSDRLADYLTLEFFVVWMLSGFIGFALSAASLRAQKLTSPTTYSMVGALSKIPLTLGGIIAFKTPISTKGAVYITLSMLSGLLYSWTKAHEDMAHRNSLAAAAAATASAATVAGGGAGGSSRGDHQSAKEDGTRARRTGTVVLSPDVEPLVPAFASSAKTPTSSGSAV